MVKVIREKTDSGPWLSVVESAGGGGTPGGSDGQVQFNDGGSFGGIDWWTVDSTLGAENVTVTGGVTIEPSATAIDALFVSVDDPTDYQNAFVGKAGGTSFFSVDGAGELFIKALDPDAQPLTVIGDPAGTTPIAKFKHAAADVLVIGPAEALGFFGTAAVAQPEVPAIPTPQDIVDALVTLGLVTQAA